MKELYIHVGIMKTGSTSLQYFLAMNQELLLRDGYIYRAMPFKEFQRLNGDGAFNPWRRNGFFLHGNAKEDRTVSLDRLKKGLDIINEWFKEESKVLLTDEDIWLFYPEWDFFGYLKEFADRNGITVKIIVFLREQSEFADSFYKELIKNRYYTGSWEEFLEHNISAEGEAMTDYEGRLSSLSRLFGKENIIVIPYEPAEWDNKGESIYSVFLNALAIPDVHDYTLPDQLYNESISFNQIEILRTIASLYCDDEEEYDRYIKSIFIKAGKKGSAANRENRKYSFFSDEDYRAFMKDFEVGNNRLAKEYLDKEELFASRPDWPKEKWSADPEEMYKDVILFFGFVNKQLYDRINHLEKEFAFSLGFKRKMRSIKERIKGLFR